jgi:NAD(P)-dependent dehydrogenase (short-subunit alcohol dehydrogenase family)
MTGKKEELMSGQPIFDFTGKSVIVTGAASGNGRATSLAFAHTGADLTLGDIQAGAMAEVAADIRRLGRRAEVVQVDVCDEGQVQKLADCALAAYGHIDILVNAAGVILRKASLEYTLKEWDWVVDVSLKGTWLCCQKVGAIMVRQGSGSIINFASGAGMRGMVGYPAYGPAKAGIINLTKGLAIEWGRQGVRINALAPGFVNTPFNRAILADPKLTAARVANTPIAAKPMEPEDLVPAIMFLCSEGGKWITGVTLPVDGGNSAR